MASATTSDWLYSRYMNFILRGGQFAEIKDVYVALFTKEPNTAGLGGTEVEINESTKYARVKITNGAGAWTDPASGGATLEISNVAEITFPVPGTSWGTIVAAGIYDASTAGNLMWIGKIGTSKPVQAGDGAPRILPNQLKISRAQC